ncbi:hypothetical protein K438DRAFT_1762603 [Mycena galopus ATCC 62051]|nr:hypothetical protein K438DRAFT_1762603 [Mycena galopus ATCC 62051]
MADAQPASEPSSVGGWLGGAQRVWYGYDLVIGAELSWLTGITGFIIHDRGGDRGSQDIRFSELSWCAAITGLIIHDRGGDRGIRTTLFGDLELSEVREYRDQI